VDLLPIAAPPRSAVAPRGAVAEARGALADTRATAADTRATVADTRATAADTRATVADTRGAVADAPPRPEVQLNPPPAANAPSPDELLELQQVASAERLLASDPARALAIVHAVEARYPGGYVGEERAYVEIMALVALGRADEARPRIARFLRDYPESAFARRVREASQHAEP
jgi:hypothetical protein